MLPITVVEDKAPSLLGLDLLSVLKLNWSHLLPSAQAEVKKLSEDKFEDDIRVQELMNEFPTVFRAN